MSQLAAVTRNASFCIALCAGLVFGCSPSSDLTGDLRAPVTGKLTVTIARLQGGSVPAVLVTSAQPSRRSKFRSAGTRHGTPW